MSTRTSQSPQTSRELIPQDAIIINRLRINSLIGVPDEERAQQQMLVVSLRMITSAGFSGLEDDVLRTVDYAAVCECVKSVAGERPRKLIETLGEDICNMILNDFAVNSVSLEIEKRILWDTDWVGLAMTRSSS